MDAKTIVPEAREMDLRTLRLHIQKRHGRLGFWSRNEHQQDHRLNGPTLDHDHAETERERERNGK